MKIKKGDTVIVTTGSFKGHRGKVLRTVSARSAVVVEGVNLKTKHRKPTQKNPAGGIEKIEAPIHISNVAYYDEQSGKPTRIRVVRDASGARTRVAVRSGRTL